MQWLWFHPDGTLTKKGKAHGYATYTKCVRSVGFLTKI